ncbi:MAG: hypothetical protein AAF320_04825, partial [Myxococcota bacterium]
QEAAEKLDVLKLSGQERRAYERYLESLMDRASFYQSTYGEGLREGHKKGLAEGEKKGRQEGMEQVARSMLAKQIAPATIREITGLTRAQLAALQRQKD